MATIDDIGTPGAPLSTPPLTAWQAAVRDMLTRPAFTASLPGDVAVPGGQWSVEILQLTIPAGTPTGKYLATIHLIGVATTPWWWQILRDAVIVGGANTASAAATVSGSAVITHTTGAATRVGAAAGFGSAAVTLKSGSLHNLVPV